MSHHWISAQVSKKTSHTGGEPAAHLSHDLRTPLNIILGFSQLMLDEVPGPINDKQRQCLNDILSSGQHLLHILNNALDPSPTGDKPCRDTTGKKNT